MKHYSKEFKEAIVKKWLESGLSLRSFSAQENINLSTLYSWRDKFHITGSNVSERNRPNSWSAEAKFSVVLETATMSGVELSEYCREKGLYPDQVKQWKQSCINNNMTEAQRKKQETTERKADKKRIKALEKELKRKDAALAETAALLVLRKKLNAYWGEDEDS